MIKCISFDLGFKTLAYTIIYFNDNLPDIKVANLVDITLNINIKQTKCV
jgi:hypothetical protein